MWPWQRSAFLERRLDVIDKQLAEVKDQNRYIIDAVSRSPALPDPFASVLVLGRSDFAGVIIAGASSIVKGTTTIPLFTQVNMRDVQIIVLCDLSRVDVVSMVNGINILSACMGECPITYTKKWCIGERLSVTCKVKEQSQ